MKILPVVLAGGSGGRLWPMSRIHYPKQFLPLVNQTSMLQDTVSRLKGIDHLPPLFICNEEHRFMVAEQLRQMGMRHSGIILEPVGRNTAPAIALAALKAAKNEQDCLLLVLAADHAIKDQEAFSRAVKNAKSLAENGLLATFGIVPDFPETGYGYIRQGDPVSGSAFRVDSFVEKPDVKTAKSYLETGEYYWNSGMFLFKASRYLEELDNYRPEILSACISALEGARTDLDFIRLDEEAFRQCPDDSIDYAVMERTDAAVVVPLNAGWSDVGSWSALWSLSDKGQGGNVIRGDVLTTQTQNSYIYSQDKLVATVGVDDLVVIETKDAVLVAKKDKVQDVKSIVAQLKEAGRTEHLQHREILRPWGRHDHIAEGGRYHVKKVTVKPGQKTATQIHYHRAEHWVVVSGTAKVRNGDKTYLVRENESTYIPIGSAHSFENPGKVALEVIEVRTGSYLSEDDIVRIDSDGEGY